MRATGELGLRVEAVGPQFTTGTGAQTPPIAPFVGASLPAQVRVSFELSAKQDFY